MPLFRRKPTDLLDESAASSVSPEEADAAASAPTKAYTPPKGRQTPKREAAQRRRVPEPPPANRREAYRRTRERQKAQRAESAEGMRRGDERYLLPRDKGPERALARDIVDSRRTVGTWFFGGALIVILGSSAAMPPTIRLAANVLWLVLAFGVVADSFLIARKVKKLVTQRFPKTQQRMGSLYLYGIMRGITFRRMRIPKPRVKIGDAV